MNKDKQRIAIAKACGWKTVNPDKQFPGWVKTVWVNPSTGEGHYVSDPRIPETSILPGYLGDLNAMHDAEKVLPPAQWDEYEENLYLVQGFDLESTGKTCFHATAPQRAEAFLRTLDLWEE